MSIALMLWMGKLSVAHICVVNTVLGFMNAFQQPASGVVNGLLVPRDRVSRMAGLQAVSSSLVGIFTPIIAAFLNSLFGLGAVMLVDMLSFIVATGSIALFIPVPEPELVKPEKREWKPFQGIREGMAFLRRDRAVLIMILVLSVMNFCSRISYENILSPMILSRNGSQQVLGLISGIMGAAGVIGGLIAAQLPAPRNCAACICGMGLASFLLGDWMMAVGRSPLVWALAAIGGSVPIPLLDSGYQELFYARVPKEIQGRVFAVRNALQFATIPVGVLLGGTLADYVFESLMAGDSALKQLLSALVGSGAGSGMAVMFLLTGAMGITACVCGYFSMKKALK